MALPGPIDNPACAGSNKLLRDGVTLVTSLDDILEEVGPLRTLAGPAEPGDADADLRSASLTGREKQLYLLLDDQPRTVDDLVRVTGLPPSAVSATLLSLELRRLGRRLPAGYVRAL